MFLLYYVQNSVVGIILVSVILFYVLGQGGLHQAQDSLFIALLLATLAIIVLELSVDILSGKVFPGSRTMLTTATLLFYIVNPVPGALYLLYVDQLRRRWIRMPGGIGIVAWTPFVAACILNIISLFNGMIFSIDSNNVYQRGSWFFLILAADLICMFLGFAYLIIYRSSFREKDFSFFLFFPLPILIGAVLQASFEGMEIAGTSLAITLLVVYLHRQSSQASKDYLTRLYNRSLGEQYLQNLISHHKKAKAIGGILMDINAFKQINDTYGHDLGDKSLRHLSRLLIDSFGATWFVARYGGDEFILFGESVTEQELEIALATFAKQLDQFNAHKTLPFSLSVSVGAALYGATNATDGPSFIKALDGLMYDEKRAFHIQQTKNNSSYKPR